MYSVQTDYPLRHKTVERYNSPPTRSLTFDQILPVPFVVQVVFLGKVSIQAHISLRVQFLNKGNNRENDRLPLGLLE